jgi:hypothetical protein
LIEKIKNGSEVEFDLNSKDFLEIWFNSKVNDDYYSTNEGLKSWDVIALPLKKSHLEI